MPSRSASPSGRGPRRSGAAAAKARGDTGRVADQLHASAIHLLRWLRREDDRGGLSGPRLSALSVIVLGGPVTLGALAAAEQVRAPTMSRLVKALEADGLVARDTDPEDGRATILRATRTGRRVLTDGRARRVKALARQLEPLSARDLALLARAAGLIERLASRAR